MTVNGGLIPTGGPRYHDLFCGAGGSSIGLTAAGMELVLAANHWGRAIETHGANFPYAEHLCEDINRYDMRRLPRADVLWASPICTEASPAGGRKRSRGQLDLLRELEEDGHVSSAGMERTRATFHDVIRATEIHRYKLVFVENVVEVASAWELFDWWVDGMRRLRPGYEVQFVSVSSAHVGDPGDGSNPHAPQWRDRLYLVFNRSDVRRPNVDPQPLAWCAECAELVFAIQWWKRPGARRIGKYGQQYLYRCPNTTCRHTIVEPFVCPAAAAIDWTNPGTRIGDRTKPLAAATMRRIQAGLDTFSEPSVVAVHGNTWERPGSGYVRAWPAGSSPLVARTATPGGGVACPPFMASVNHNDEGDSAARVYPIHTRPLATRTAKIGDGLVVPAAPTVLALVGELRRNSSVRTADDAPLYTITAGGSHHFVTTHTAPPVPPVPAGAFVSKHHGGLDYERIEHMNKSVHEPFPAVVARPNLSLVIPYRRASKAHRANNDALSTVATHDQHGLATPTAQDEARVDINDCYFRMLQPREHLRAQRFHDTYVVTGNKTEQTMQAGNAVSANVAQWLGTAGMEVLS